MAAHTPELTPERLAELLGRPGDVPEVSTRSIGTGQVGENVRWTLRWPDATADDERPRSVVLKLPSDDETSRATAAATGSYVKEVGFYRDLQSTVDIRTPRIHEIVEDRSANWFRLVMEDITPATQGDQLAGCSVERAELAVDEIARLHGPHWGGARLGAVEWLAPRSQERAGEMQGLYDTLFAGFADRYEARLGSDAVALGRRLGERFARWYTSFTTPITLVHGDFRLDNLLFGLDRPAPPLTTVDWQTAAQGHGPADAAYFVGAGLLPDQRREVEEPLFRRYVAGLRHYGVETDEAALWHDYCLGSATGYVMAVIASQIVVQTDRGDEMFCVMAERHADQMAHLGLLDLVG